MGACVCKDDLSRSGNAPEDDERRPLNSSRNFMCLGSRECNDGSLFYRITFSEDDKASPEGKVLESMCQLLYEGRGSERQTQDKVLRCISLFEEGLINKDSMVLDFVAPLVNLILHTDSRIRDALWGGFVRRAICQEPAFAHRFFWSLSAAAHSPDVSAQAKKEAEKLLDEINTFWSSAFADSKMLKGKTPLVHLLSQLDVIGNDILVLPRADRAQFLSQKLDTINKDLAQWTASVPAFVLTPDSNLNSPPVKLLRVCPDESFVLSSKQRAPYHVLLEVEEAELETHDRTPSCENLDSAMGRDRSASDIHTSVREAKTGPMGSVYTRMTLVRSAVEDQMVSQSLTDSLPSFMGGGADKPASPSAAGSRDEPTDGSSSGAAPDRDQRPHSPRVSRGRVSRASRDSTGGADEDLVESDEEKVIEDLKDRDRKPKGLFKRETWEQVVDRVKKSSSAATSRNWRVMSLIVKSAADDVRQEELACRLLRWFSRVFERHKQKLWLRPFGIVATDYDAGCLETIPNAISIDALKKTYGNEWVSLKAYFEQAFPQIPFQAVVDNKLPRKADAQRQTPQGRQKTVHELSEKWVPLSRAVLNYVRSMAAYSIVCYVLAIRDRHNGNILLDDEGHIIHVDFGFMLCGAPGGRVIQKMGGWEPSRGFKLTAELVEVMGGSRSRMFQLFRNLVCKGLLAVRKESSELLALLQLGMLGSENHSMPCFNHPKGDPQAVLEDIKLRLQLPMDSRTPMSSDLDFHIFVNELIDRSVDNWRSRWYDRYQYYFNGLL
eukprot:gnl/MRDRNA2_/MRDRNA2_146811_c0_seq1.p1 gnl/MRDRNA2_/MRDRNA2_146811_c0~~gnl/MRDRNA2_/MRDRNA2_146811_c0_seq1.p1  ORF type:complete len:778 (+),score=124.54 gnl/MRDRNA2_/MRDRNA2_146811_c0_seq1:73-2406(+)